MVERNGEALDWLDDLIEAIGRLHDAILEESGGLAGIHEDKLESAVARPFHSAFGEPIFHTAYEQAAALFHGIIMGHVFADANKRTASVATALMLRQLAALGEPTSLQMRMLGELAVHTASGGVTVDDVAFWLERIFAPREEAST